MTPEKTKQVVGVVKEWRKKTFCTCRYIRGELKLKVSLATSARTLNKNGYYWKAVPKKNPFTDAQLEKRRNFIDMYGYTCFEWWCDDMDLIFDGVALIKAPQTLSKRQNHAAQTIKAMWMKRGAAMDPHVHTFNRYSSAAS